MPVSLHHHPYSGNNRLRETSHDLPGLTVERAE